MEQNLLDSLIVDAWRATEVASLCSAQKLDEAWRIPSSSSSATQPLNPLLAAIGEQQHMEVSGLSDLSQPVWTDR